ncbi:hypothetical protein DO97_08260 [Neosynechococcus sphagnicola sy1]|uniref:Sulfotransferase family protein n=2 Tax=Neosynechococcus TaxID=1501143 RepID=A0A098TKZ9_9CYAN|nr:hypothetical protein DO97_08260 [Neosynechococcus sphagnicola sy1]
MIRFFRYSNESYNNLNQNSKHKFAQSHALNIFGKEAIYSFIPKNACSTLRTTIAYANGCIRDKSDFNWIHKNNHTFSATLSELARAKYTFTILRCPFARLVSAYLDKIVSRDTVAWNYIDLHNRKIDIEDITFDFFVRSMSKPNIRDGDIHWRPQIDFLVYEEYDDYFCLENFSKVETVLRDRIGIDIIDVRPLTSHTSYGFNLIDDNDFSNIKPFELLKYKLNRALPHPKNMYNDELIELTKKAYSDDISLYQSKIDRKTLMYS